MWKFFGVMMVESMEGVGNLCGEIAVLFGSRWGRAFGGDGASIFVALGRASLRGDAFKVYYPCNVVVFMSENF